MGGYIVIVTNLHEEATEDELIEQFSEFGQVGSCHLNIDRRTGFAKGYALLEYSTLEEATAAVQNGNGMEVFTLPVKVDFAFVESGSSEISRDDRKSGWGNRERSRSPDR